MTLFLSQSSPEDAHVSVSLQKRKDARIWKSSACVPNRSRSLSRLVQKLERAGNTVNVSSGVRELVKVK